MSPSHFVLAALVAAVPVVGCGAETQPVATEATADGRWSSFLTAADVAAEIEAGDVVVIDARKADEYAAGHIPGAINLPGGQWRTGKAKPGQGDSQYLFRTADGSLDVERYERLLGDAGVTADDRVIVYGNHAGKTDGSIPVMILDILGHDDVAFLDGVGLTEWIDAGHDVSTSPAALPPADYVADANASVIWDLDDVLAHVGDESVVFVDTRSEAEFNGDAATLEKRGNARGGHIPGAVLLNYADHLNADKNTLSPAEIAEQFAARGVEKDDTVVLYCQTATRVSLPYLALRDLGFEDVRVYDASWHEYGNRDDTPIEGASTAAAESPATGG